MSERTKNKLKQHKAALPVARRKMQAAAVMLLVAIIISSTATYAWMTFSKAPSVSHILTTFASNGSLEIGLAGRDGSQPSEFDINESVGFNNNIVYTNRRWGNIINLSDPSYGMDQIVLRPALLNPSSVDDDPLKCYEFDENGRVDESKITPCTYTAFNGTQFIYNEDRGVRAISSYEEAVTDSTTRKRSELQSVVDQKQMAVNKYYKANVSAAMGTLSDMISTYAQEKVNDTGYAPANSTIPVYFTKAHLMSAKSLYDELYNTMELQKEAYIALANYQLYTDYGDNYVEVTSFDEFYNNPSQYNVDAPNGESKDKIICLQGLTTFVNDYKTLCDDREHFRIYIEEEWKDNYYSFSTGGHGPQIVNNDKPALSCEEHKCDHANITTQNNFRINYMIARLINYSTMYIIDKDGNKQNVTALQNMDKMKLLGLNGSTRPCYITAGIMQRLEQSIIQSGYRLPNSGSDGSNSTCRITIGIKLENVPIFGKYNFSVKGETHTTAEGDSYFNANLAASVAKGPKPDKIAKDIYGMAVDFWVRCNAESTFLVLGGATTVDVNGNVMQYDGINRVWGSTSESALPNSTTQGGGSCYVYYADTPEDMYRSLSLLRGYKVAFVENGQLIAEAVMDTNNYYAVNGRITVPLVIDETSGTSYTYIAEDQSEKTGRAITKLVVDEPQNITAIIYLAGEKISNTDVLAASEIVGQLNIQFASSKELTTIGDKDLQNATRTVTASVNKTEFNYNEALNDADLTAKVTVNVDGASPRTVIAYFMRAINETQGQREAVTTFTKQDDGSWKADHIFKNPGVYYLRYVRLDGIDYALPEPVVVYVKGFEIASVTWGLGSIDEHTVYTVDNGFRVDVSVKYATDNFSKLPSKVQARFQRDDGVTVSADLAKGNDGSYTGTASFQTSGHYTLAYLVQFTADSDVGIYADLINKGFDKSLNLYLGMRAEVYNTGNGDVTDEYDPAAPVGTYYKDVIVKIFDNAGNIMGGLENAVLKYKPGTVDTNLTWDDTWEYYTGQLQITKAGRYEFASITVAGNVLTRAVVSPTYVIVPPNPPQYDGSVESEFSAAAGKVQFAPFTNDAYIGPICIQNAETAKMMAYVRNNITGERYECSLANAEHIPGTIYRSSVNPNNYYIYLPSYTFDVDQEGKPLANAAYSQEGVWTVEGLAVWDCYDSDRNFVEEESPLLFAASLPQGYNGKLVQTNFAAHSTEVSCSIKLEMFSGETALGNNTTPFMTQHSVANAIGTMSITDNSGHVIPADKIHSVKITYSYTKPNDNASYYGYKVKDGLRLGGSYDYKWDTTSQKWVIQSTDTWRYVGEYVVSKVEVTMKGTGYVLSVDMANRNNLSVTDSNNVSIETIANGASGVVDKYTVRSAAPSVDNISVQFSNGTTEFSGTFLQEHRITTCAQTILYYTVVDENGDEIQIKETLVDVDVKPYLQLVYQTSSKPTWVNWTNSDYQNIGPFEISSKTDVLKTLLPGTYKQYIIVNGQTITSYVNSEGIEVKLKDIIVKANAPEIKVAAVSPSGAFNTNLATSKEELKYWDYANLIGVQNYKTDYTARIFIQASKNSDVEGIDTINYSLPKITLSLSNITNFATATVVVPNAASSTYNKTFSFSSSTLSVQQEIGGKDTKSETSSESGTCGGGEDVSYNYDLKYEAGVQVIRTIQVTGNDNKVYTITLSNPVTITENHEAPPSITFELVEGYSTPESKVSDDGNAFTITLPSTIGTTNGTRSVESGNTSTGWDGITPTITTVGSYAYVTIIPNPDSEDDFRTNKVTSGCEGKKIYYYYQYVSHNYTRYQYVYEKTTTVTTYDTINGVVKWKVGDVEYNPGEEITVSGAVTATPIIGVISETFKETKTSTLVHTTEKDVHVGDSNTITQSTTTHESSKAAFDAITPTSGYKFYNASDIKDGSWVNTTEHQVMDDYTK